MIPSFDAPPTVPGSQSRWEAAFERFETPGQEIAKFKRRLRRLGAAQWARDAAIVEIFCGRGNGLHALASLGFQRLEGVDLSRALLDRYQGKAVLYHADCRELPFEDESKDILIVQGGLHHLPQLPEDLERCLRSAVRVLRPGGRLVAVEPWATPFLESVHTLAFWKPCRRLFPRLDAFATMVEEEHSTYHRWLSQPGMIRGSLQRHFHTEQWHVGWGKLLFVGTRQVGSRVAM